MSTNLINSNPSDVPFYTVEEWQDNWDSLLDRVENGEHIGITNGEERAVMIPADDEIMKLYTDHNEAS